MHVPIHTKPLPYVCSVSKGVVCISVPSVAQSSSQNLVASGNAFRLIKHFRKRTAPGGPALQPTYSSTTMETLSRLLPSWTVLEGCCRMRKTPPNCTCISACAIDSPARWCSAHAGLARPPDPYRAVLRCSSSPGAAGMETTYLVTTRADTTGAYISPATPSSSSLSPAVAAIRYHGKCG
jgi:hypothetical protein